MLLNPPSAFCNWQRYCNNGNDSDPALAVGGWGPTPSTNNKVYNNAIYNNTGAGIQLGGSSSPLNTLVENNILYGNGTDSIVGSNDGGSVVRNNFTGNPSSAPSGMGAGAAAAGSGSGAPATPCTTPSTPKPASPSAPSQGTGTTPSKSGQKCFMLGGQDRAADSDPGAAFNGNGITTAAYSDLAAGKSGTFASKVTADSISRGIGVDGGGAGQEIDPGEGVVVSFGGARKTHATVGLRDLYKEEYVSDGVETASWAAYRDGKVVAQGTVDGTDPLNEQTLGNGKAQFEISVADGFDQVMFFSNETESDYGVEFIEGKATPGFDCDGGALASSGSPNSRSESVSQPGSGSGSGAGGGSSSSGAFEPAAGSGQVCFTLGGKNVPEGAFDVAAMWQQQESVTVAAYSDLASGTAGELGSLPPVNGETRGIGVGGEIEKGEGLVMTFKQPQENFTVGVRDLYKEKGESWAPGDGVETASWVAYKNGKLVAQGTVDGTAPLNEENYGIGKAQFEINVPGGIDQLMFYSDEDGSDYHVEYVEAKNCNGCGGYMGSGSGNAVSPARAEDRNNWR